MTCEIVAAPAAIAQMLSADRSIRGTVPCAEILLPLCAVTRRFFGASYFYYLLSPMESGLHRSSPGASMLKRLGAAAKRYNWNVQKDLNTSTWAAKHVELN